MVGKIPVDNCGLRLERRVGGMSGAIGTRIQDLWLRPAQAARHRPYMQSNDRASRAIGSRVWPEGMRVREDGSLCSVLNMTTAKQEYSLPIVLVVGIIIIVVGVIIMPTARLCVIRTDNCQAEPRRSEALPFSRRRRSKMIRTNWRATRNNTAMRPDASLFPLRLRQSYERLPVENRDDISGQKPGIGLAVRIYREPMLS
jgi:hypothetical protein